MAAGAPRASPTPARASRYRRRAEPRLSVQFLRPGQVAALCCAMLVLGVLLFPKASIDRQLHTTAAPDAATIAYLNLLLRAKPGDSPTRMQLVNQRLRAGQLQQAESELAPLLKLPEPPPQQVGMMWVTLRRAQLMAVPADSPNRIGARARYAQALGRFASQLSPEQQLGEVRQAIDAGLYKVAAELAGHLLAVTTPSARAQSLRPGLHAADVDRPGPLATRTAYPSERTQRHFKPGLMQMVGLIWSPRFDQRPGAFTSSPTVTADLRKQAFEALLQSHLAAGHPLDALVAAQAALPTLDGALVDWPQLVRIAIGADQPAAAAGFAERWLDNAPDVDTRWAAFRALIGAWLATGHPAQALTAASLHLQQMPQTTELWRLMTELAVQAGDGDQAARYARRLVGLGVSGA